MVDLGTYVFKDLNIGKNKTEEQFTDAYVKEVYKSEHVRTDAKRLLIILYAKYGDVDLHKVMETQCQHLTKTEHNDFLKLLQKYEEFFDGRLGTWKTDPVYFELKQDVNTVYQQPYPVPKLHDKMFKNEFKRLVLL